MKKVVMDFDKNIDLENEKNQFKVIEILEEIYK